MPRPSYEDVGRPSSVRSTESMRSSRGYPRIRRAQVIHGLDPKPGEIGAWSSLAGSTELFDFDYSSRFKKAEQEKTLEDQLKQAGSMKTKIEVNCREFASNGQTTSDPYFALHGLHPSSSNFDIVQVATTCLVAFNNLARSDAIFGSSARVTINSSYYPYRESCVAVVPSTELLSPLESLERARAVSGGLSRVWCEVSTASPNIDSHMTVPLSWEDFKSARRPVTCVQAIHDGSHMIDDKATESCAKHPSMISKEVEALFHRFDYEPFNGEEQGLTTKSGVS
ncbi:uncharacterized protein Y057_8490 [Fusarium fujikuroi]|nr:uncharacterized protein Y057_8490 [Fusarium fujikuroi]SCO25692.1 uncharacterized protein FFC1_15664 [Fusarium fujikuroi]